MSPEMTGNLEMPSSSGEASKEPGKIRFERFPRLPFEIRQMVWKYICFDIRNVDLWARDGVQGSNPLRTRSPILNQFRRQFEPVKAPVYRSSCLPPALLHTSQEARKEGLRWYSLLPGTPAYPRSEVPAVSPRFYINWASDRLCLMHPYLIHYPHHDHPHNSLLQLFSTKKLHRLAQCREGLYHYNNPFAVLPDLQDHVVFRFRRAPQTMAARYYAPNAPCECASFEAEEERISLSASSKVKTLQDALNMTFWEPPERRLSGLAGGKRHVMEKLDYTYPLSKPNYMIMLERYFTLEEHWGVYH